MSFPVINPVFQFLDDAGEPLSSGTVSTYAANSTTPKITYQNAALSVANTAIINLDGAGRCSMFVADGETYKYIVKDANGNVIATQDNVLSPSGAIVHAQTAAEAALTITPTSTAVDTTDYTNVMRYVSNTIDSVNSQAAAFQKAFDIARISGKAITIPSPTLGGSYILDAPINCTLSAADATSGTANAGFTVRGEGNILAATQSLASPARATIVIRHTGHAFDCTGAFGINWENLSIGTDVTTYPKTAWLLARYNAVSPGGSIHRFRNVRTYGKFSEAVVYNYGAEDDQYDACQFFNVAGTANAKVMVFSAYNVRGLTSTFTSIATGSQSCIDHKIVGGEFLNKTNHANGDVFYLDAIAGLKVYVPWMGCGNDSGANPRSLIFCDPVNGPSNHILLHGITGENLASLQTHAITMTGTARTFSFWDVQGCNLPNLSNALYADTGMDFSNLNWRANGNSSIGGGLNLKAVVNSNIEELLMSLSIVTSTNNIIKTNSTGFTVTSRVGDTWIDSATRTWTPGTAGLTVTGALTVNNNRFEYSGKKVDAEFAMSAVTSIVCAAGVAITNLPRAITIGVGRVQVTNLATGAAIPGGYVTGTTIVLPAINVGAGVAVGVSVTYFVA